MTTFDSRLRYDGIESYLASDLSAGETTITLTDPLTFGGGQSVPSFSTGEYLSMTILDGSYRMKEIVYVYDYAVGSTTLTVARGQEGTSNANTFPSGSKILHAPSVLDYLLVQDHAIDPLAHNTTIQTIADASAATAIDAHKAESDPHPVYLTEAELVAPYTGNITLGPGATLTIMAGATLNVLGTLDVSGTLIVNGHEIVVSDVEPTNPTANTVWIQTYGV